MGLYENICSSLTNPLLAGPVIGGFVMLLAYIDSKLRDVEREKETYYKLFIVTSLIATLIVYLIVEEFTKTDEFLSQTYDTDIPKELMAGGNVAGTASSSAATVLATAVGSTIMKGPSLAVDLNSLVPGDIADPLQMKVKRVKKKHRR